jgi:hypothetical protein
MKFAALPPALPTVAAEIPVHLVSDGISKLFLASNEGGYTAQSCKCLPIIMF